jgi:peptidoglycan/xylan/chitin deacetylase (PgdA/CDA1 family)
MKDPRGGEGAPIAPFRVALTFDAEHPDRPSRPGVQEELLDALRDLQVRASFFVQGRWAEAYPETARRILSEGHLVGSHSHYHARMPLFSAAGLENDVRTAEALITQIVGVDPRPWFRCPFGAGQDDPRILAQLKDLGYRAVGWHVTADDWEPTASDASVEKAVVEGSREHGDGAVVLLHTWPRPTMGALPGVVERLRKAGASFARIDELPGPLPVTPGWAAEPVATE